MTGIILKAISGFYYVCCDGVTFECKARGSFRRAGVSPLVGDKAEIVLSDSEHGTVENILERRNSLSRPAVANVDRLFIISSFETPPPNALMIDRLTAIAEYNDIEPVIVFNKCDMGDFSEWKQIYTRAGFKTYVVSASTGEGIDGLIHELTGITSVFTGNSGVGKSSILNALFGDLALATGEVSEKLGRGRHTTRHTELYRHHYGGYVADTPGFSSVDVESGDYKFKERLAECFRDFSDYTDSCQFTSCTHINEKGCGVLKAVKDGEIEQTRFSSYKEIFTELKNLKPWNVKNNK